MIFLWRKPLLRALDRDRPTKGIEHTIMSQDLITADERGRPDHICVQDDYQLALGTFSHETELSD